jgi:hypothetical protein
MLALTLGVALVASACGASDTSAPGAGATMASSPGVGASTRGSDLDAYPQLYRTMDLPTLPGATVTSTGRQTTSLRDGLAIRLTTSMNVAEARDYYRQELTTKGWTEQVGPGQAAQAMLPNLPLARLAFVKGALLYTATVTASAGVTQVAIDVTEP